MNGASIVMPSGQRTSASGRDCDRDWIICQIGAREHYALAAELHRRERLRALCTDVWAGEGSVWRAVAALSSSRGPDIRGRYESSLADARVISLGAAPVALASVLERLDRRRAPWGRLMAANRRFARAMARRLESGDLLRPRAGLTPIVFAYSYAAREIFSVAKRAGCVTVLGQLDPGPEEDVLVAGAARRHGWNEGEIDRPPKSYWDNWREECRLADFVLVNSEWSARLTMRAGVPSSKLIVAPLAYRLDSSRRIERETIRAYPDVFTVDRPLSLLFLGAINFRKGCCELIEAMWRLRDAPVRLMMVGRVDAPVSMSAGHARNIEWVGPVARSDTGAFYRRADVFVLPTHSDGFAITQLEALAYDLPVIASRHCGDVIEDKKQGLRLEAVTAEAIEGAVRWVLSHPDLLASMATRASARLAQFAPDRVIDSLIEEMGAASS